MSARQGESPEDRRARYLLLVEHRLCPVCKTPVDREEEEAVYCSRHTGRHTPPAQQRKYRAAWVKEQLALGFCGRCGQRERKIKRDGRRGQHCEECARKQAQKARARWLAKHTLTKTLHCATCGQAGHNAAGCYTRPADVVAPSIDEYATVRREWT